MPGRASEAQQSCTADADTALGMRLGTRAQRATSAAEHAQHGVAQHGVALAHSIGRRTHILHMHQLTPLMPDLQHGQTQIPHGRSSQHTRPQRSTSAAEHGQQRAHARTACTHPLHITHFTQITLTVRSTCTQKLIERAAAAGAAQAARETHSAGHAAARRSARTTAPTGQLQPALPARVKQAVSDSWRETRLLGRAKSEKRNRSTTAL